RADRRAPIRAPRARSPPGARRARRPPAGTRAPRGWRGYRRRPGCRPCFRDNLPATACRPLALTANFFVVKSRKLLSCFGYSAVRAAATPRDDRRLDHARIGGLDEVVVEPGVDRAGAVFFLSVTCQRDQQRRRLGALQAQPPRH